MYTVNVCGFRFKKTFQGFCFERVSVSIVHFFDYSKEKKPKKVE